MELMWDEKHFKDKRVEKKEQHSPDVTKIIYL